MVKEDHADRKDAVVLSESTLYNDTCFNEMQMSRTQCTDNDIAGNNSSMMMCY